MTQRIQFTQTIEVTDREANLIKQLRSFPPGHSDHFPEGIDPNSVAAHNLYECQAYFLYGRFEYLAQMASYLEKSKS
ncbi:MAG: hypothetical protein AAFY91_10690 [Bacteroidota bacterium]